MTSILDFIAARADAATPPTRQRRRRAPATSLRVAMHFQQVTGPVMAKAAEDTAFYRYVRLLALNEVGGDPAPLRHVGRRLSPAWRSSAPGTGRARC